MQINRLLIQAYKIVPIVLVMGILFAAFGFDIGPVSATSVASPAFVTDENLDNDSTKWGTYTEVQVPGTPPPTREINNITNPSLDGRSLRCAITGGVKYSNVHFYRNLPSDPDSNTFMLSIWFYYRPRSTFNNVGGSSIVQALEFTMNKWYQGQRYEWALQWNNVGPGAPEWRYWGRQTPNGPLDWFDLNIAGSLAGEEWHNLKLEGDIVAGQVHYRRFTIDGQIHLLNISVAPATEADVPDKLAVAVQLDGNNWNGTGELSPYEVFLDKVTFVHVNGTSVDHFIGNTLRGTFLLDRNASTRASFSGVNNGPVQIVSSNGVPLIAAERVIYKVNGVNTSFAEMMGLPNSELDNVYYLPWYNNVDLDTQLRFANVSGSTASVQVLIGGQQMQGSPFNLAPGASTRKSFAANNGPVKIVSNVNIVVAERVIYKVNGVLTSFAEMMALPEKQLDTTYWLPWYNNVDLDTQLRIANVGNSPTNITVTIGGVAKPSFALAAGASTRMSYPVNTGPVKIQSTQPIVAAERVIYKVNGIPTSFTETMALPNALLNTIHWLPWYNNVDLSTDLRIGNTTNSAVSVQVFIGGQQMQGSPFNVPANQSVRKTFAGVNNGLVKIVSNGNIVVSEGVIYKVNNVNTSFSELMSLPHPLRNPIYWLPWYNNVDLDTQLRFGVP